MEDKLQLLDAAIATNDGNCIMAMVLFIRRTVNEGTSQWSTELSPCGMWHGMAWLTASLPDNCKNKI